MQKIFPEEFDDIAFYCQELSNIISIYTQLRKRHPESSGEELRDLFLWCIREFMKQGKLRYLGEGHIRLLGEGFIIDGALPKFPSRPDAPLMFGDKPFGPEDVVVDNLKQPKDPSPEGIAELIRSQWPPEVVLESPSHKDGFDWIWFDKWQFEWLDKEGNPIYF